MNSNITIRNNENLINNTLANNTRNTFIPLKDLLSNDINFNTNSNEKLIYNLSLKDINTPELLLEKYSETVANGTSEQQEAILAAFVDMVISIQENYTDIKYGYWDAMERIILQVNKHIKIKLTGASKGIIEDAIYKTLYGYLPTLLYLKTCSIAQEDIIKHMQNDKENFAYSLAEYINKCIEQ